MTKSTVISATGVITDVSGSLHNVNVTIVGTGASSITIYDNATTNSGNIIFQGDGLAEQNFNMGNGAGEGSIFSQGMYIVLAGTIKPTVVVTYE